MPVNAELLREIADKIEVEPQLYYQGSWSSLLVYVESEERALYSQRAQVRRDINICGTAHCIAGWAMSLSGWTAVRVPYVDPGTGGVTQVELGWAAPGQTEPGVEPDEMEEGAQLLGFEDIPDHPGGLLRHIFGGGWMPREGLSVPEALRAIAAGAGYWDVSTWYYDPDMVPPYQPPIEQVQAMAEVW